MSKIKQFCNKNKNNIKYQVRFGVQLNDNEDESGVFAKPEYYASLEKAKAMNIFNDDIKYMFPDAKHNGLFMTKDIKCECCGENVSSVKYSNGGKQLFGRMDIKFGGGEGFIDIVEA